MLSGRKQFVGGMSGALAIALALVGGAGACGGGGGAGGTSPIGGAGAGGGGNLSQRPAAAVPLFDEGRVHELALDDERGRLAVDHRRLARRRVAARLGHVRRRGGRRRRRAARGRELALRRQPEDVDPDQVRRVRRTREVRRLRRRQRQGRVRRRIDDARAPGAVRVRHVHARAQGGARDADGQRRRCAVCSRCARTGTRRRSRSISRSRSVRSTGSRPPCRADPYVVRRRRSRQLRSAAVGAPYQEGGRGRRGRRRRS